MRLHKHLTLILLLIVHFGYSQSNSFEIRAGINVSSVASGANWEAYQRDLTYKAGLAIGLNYQHDINKNIFLSTGLLYDNRGNTSAIRLVNKPDGKIYSKYNYIGIPLRIGFYGIKSNRVQVSFGLIPAYLMSAHMKIGKSFQSNLPNGSIPSDFTSIVNRIDISGQIELGINIAKFSSSELSLYFRAMHGITKLYSIGDHSSGLHLLINTSIGYSFGMKEAVNTNE